MADDDASSSSDDEAAPAAPPIPSGVSRLRLGGFAPALPPIEATPRAADDDDASSSSDDDDGEGMTNQKFDKSFRDFMGARE